MFSIVTLFIKYSNYCIFNDKFLIRKILVECKRARECVCMCGGGCVIFSLPSRLVFSFLESYFQHYSRRAFIFSPSSSGVVRVTGSFYLKYVYLI